MPKLTKIITIISCEDCPYHMFDYEAGDSKYWHKHICFFGLDLNAEGTHSPILLKNARVIPKNCPLP